MSRPPPPRPVIARPVIARPVVARPAAPPGPTRRQPPGRRIDRPATGAGGSVGERRVFAGFLAGAQAAVLSLLVVVMPALAAYVATATDPSNADVGWTRSVTVGAGLWLMAHGGAVTAGGATVSLVPLGLTALALFSCYASARRSAPPTRAGWGAAIGGYVAVVTVTVLLAGQQGPLGGGAGSIARTAVGATALAAVGLGAGTLRGGRFGELARPRWMRLPAVVRAGITGGVMVAALLVVGAATAAGLWAVSGRAATGDVVAALDVDLFSGLLLAIAQLALVPNMVLWAVAWLAGPGFAVGAGTVYSPAEVVAGPLPALPLLGGLPSPAAAGGVVQWVPVLVVGAGAVAGWWLHRRLDVTRPWEPLAAAVCAAVTAGVVAGALSLLAGGSAGPGRFQVVGAAALPVTASVVGLSLIGVFALAVPMDAVVRAALARRLRAGWARVGGGSRATRAAAEVGSARAVHVPR